MPDAKLVERYAVGVQKPRHIMVRCHQEAGGVKERPVVEQDARVDMAMWADQWQTCYLAVQAPGDGPMAGVGGEQAVGVEPQRRYCRSHLPIVVPGLSARNRGALTP